MLPIMFQQLAAKPITFAIPSFNLASLAVSTPLITLPNKDLVIVPKVLQHDKGYLDISADLELRDTVLN